MQANVTLLSAQGDIDMGLKISFSLVFFV